VNNFEGIKKNEVSMEELQDYINSPDLNLPEMRRDLSKPENVRWLIRNIWIRNKVPAKYLEALKKHTG
jgi:hypothetical protein